MKWYKWVISHALVVGAVSGKCALPSTTKATENNENPLTVPEGKPPISKYLEVDENIYLGDGVPERLPPPKVEPEIYQQDDTYESAPPVKSEPQGPGRFISLPEKMHPLCTNTLQQLHQLQNWENSQPENYKTHENYTQCMHVRSVHRRFHIYSMHACIFCW